MTCSHVRALPASVVPESTEGCVDCLALGERKWAHLRMCLSCGHVACCDSSPHRHATAHFRASQHPVMRSVEPGEDWRWCYVDGAIV
ncbi:UBP-type zinc finger domain-containing protein [Lentzea sp. HUAS12]|uniref:UBP-type zinc finger domain-containing protein n=1 Tax=Lentzea sp. HUAS12 TaxID=2951806 RepID=UPI0020A13B5B|nr:UBP-type zinc finger domain-containing protein [Lentzea sp. HUAS12]USX50322.1 UBP-type zinc finger domain-containing protein [Lentzea sp. HUAS12]